MTLSHTESQIVACPHCGVAKGIECMRPNGRPLNPAGVSHQVRVRLAYETYVQEQIAAARLSDIEQRRQELRRLPEPLAHHVLTLDHFWCDTHGEVHGWTTDPYNYGEVECDPKDWRRVFIESNDPNEEF